MAANNLPGNVFSIEDHNSYQGLQKLGYLADVLGFKRVDIARIVGEDPRVIVDALITGVVAEEGGRPAENQQVTEKCYKVRMLLSKVMRYASYDAVRANNVLEDATRIFRQCIVPPPWYEARQTLRAYIVQGGMSAAEASLLWLQEN